MEAAPQQEFVKVPLIDTQRVGVKKFVAKPPIRLEHGPGEQAAHVQLFNPGIGQNIIRQIKTQLLACDQLRLTFKVFFML